MHTYIHTYIHTYRYLFICGGTDLRTAWPYTKARGGCTVD